MTKRIIARLDIKNKYLVKGIHLEGLRILGFPESFAKVYYDQGIDEIYFHDVVASLYKRNQSKSIVKKITKNIFVPIIVGGGIRSNEDIQDILINGADRVSVNTAAISDINFIKKSSLKFGSSTISITIETLKIDGKYKVYTDSGRNEKNIDLFEWIKKVEDFGAGEIILTSVNNEGTGKGFDLELYEKARDCCTIPLLAHGGAGELSHVVDLFKKIDLEGCVIASSFHYHYIQNFSKKNIVTSGSTDFLKKSNLGILSNFTIKSLKENLKLNNIKVR